MRWFIVATEPPEAHPSVTSSPALIWVAIVCGVLIAVAAALPQIFGPLSRALSDWLESSRARAAAKDDADITERDRVISYQQGVIDAQRVELRERDELIAVHTVWDWEMQYDRPHPSGKPAPPLHPIRTASPAAVAREIEQREGN